MATETVYLNPKIIDLNELDFLKMPVINYETTVDFCIVNAGTITDFNIDMNLLTNTITKSILQNGINITNSTPNFFVSDSTGDIAEFVLFNPNITENFFNLNLLNSTNTKNLLHGTIFTLIVKAIFVGIDTSLINFSDENIRTDTVFFQTDGTNGMTDNIILKTQEALNTTITIDDEEFAYWNARMYASDEVQFENNDQFYIIYAINIHFSTGNLENINYKSFDNLNALSLTGGIVTPFDNVDLNYIFGLSWNLQYTEPEPEPEPEQET